MYLVRFYSVECCADMNLNEFEASLTVTWPLNVHTLFIKAPLWKGQRNRGLTRGKEIARKTEGEKETVKESLLAAMLKVCCSYSAE